MKQYMDDCGSIMSMNNVKVGGVLYLLIVESGDFIFEIAFHFKMHHTFEIPSLPRQIAPSFAAKVNHFV